MISIRQVECRVYYLGLAGAGLTYDDDWTGRYKATNVNLLLIVLVPTLAYQGHRQTIGWRLPFSTGTPI